MSSDVKAEVTVKNCKLRKFDGKIDHQFLALFKLVEKSIRYKMKEYKT